MISELILKRILMIALVLFGLINATQAEDTKNTNFFLTGNVYLNDNIYMSDFRELPGFPNCCTNFKSAFGLAPSFGVGGEYKFDEEFIGMNFRYSFKLMYSDLSANYSVDEHIGNNIVGNEVQKIISTYRLEPTIKTIATEHLVAIYPEIESPISFLAGFQLAFPMSPEVYQIEKMKSPSDLNFSETGTRTRGDTTGKLIEASSALFALSIGARYEAHKFENFSIVPELIFNLGLNDVVSSRNWKASSLRAGVALHYNIQKSLPKSIEPPVKPPMPSPELPVISDFDFVLNVKYRDRLIKNDGSILIPLVKDEVVEYTHFLPILFYKKGSTQLNNSLSANSQIGNKIDVYEKLKQFLKTNPAPLICYIGTSNDESDDMFEKRKNHIIAVLKEQGIDELDNFLFKHVPTDVSKLKEELKEESRYVLFKTAGEKSIPLKDFHLISEKTRSSNKNVIKFEAVIPPETAYESYSLSAVYDGKELYTTKDVNGRINFIDEYFSKGFEEILPLEVIAVLKSKDNRVVSKSTSLRIEAKLGKISRITNVIDGKETMVFGLFDYDSCKFSVIDRVIVDRIEEAVEKGKKIRIIPYTDNIGNPKYNNDLAQKRAEAFLREFKLKETDYTIEFPSNYLYDNKDPMGRVLNRCVVVVFD